MDVNRLDPIVEVAQDSPLATKKRKKRKSVLLKPKRRSRPSLETTTPLVNSSPGAAINEEVQLDNVDEDRAGEDAQADAIAHKDQPVPPLDEGPVATPKSTTPIKRRKKRRSVLIKSKRKSRPSLASAVGEIGMIPDQGVVGEAEEMEGTRDEGADVEGNQLHGNMEQPVDKATTTTTARSTPKKKKRKSIVLGRKKRRSSEGKAGAKQPELEESADLEQPLRPEQADGEEEPVVAKVAKEQKRRGRPRLQDIFKTKQPLAVSKGNTTVRSPKVKPSKTTLKERLKSVVGKKSKVSQEIQADDENASDEAEEAERAVRPGKGKRARIDTAEESESDGEISSPRKRRRLAPKTTKSKDKPSSLDSPKKKKSKEATGDKIHVTVQRISHVHRLNFNPDSDDDLAGPGAFPKKKTPNAIDVLAQICREMIGKTISTVKNGIQNEANTARKNELKRKRELFERYGDELDGRLYQMTTALDHNYALGVKLKHANKQKAALRDELLEMRKQRQELDLQMDELRGQNEEDARVANEEHTLDTLLQDIELAVQRGKAAQEHGDEEEDDDDHQDEDGGLTLAMRLQQVADTVSSADGRVGTLERVKGFNKLLEQAIEKL